MLQIVNLSSWQYYIKVKEVNALKAFLIDVPFVFISF